MMNNREKSAMETLTLTQDVVRFGGMQLSYALTARASVPHNRFEISVSLDGETATAELGDQLEIAMESYRRIVSGIVTPCTLEEVVRDLEYSHRNLRKKLYKRAFL